jgi:hypothetical protein
MQRLHSRSRLNSAIGAAKAAKHVKRLSPASAFEQIERIDKLASTINRLHGSPDAATQATRPIRLELLASATAQVVEADWTAQPQLQDCDGTE